MDSWRAAISFLIFLIAAPVPAKGEGVEAPPIKPAWELRWEKAKDLVGKGSLLEAERVYGVLLGLEQLGRNKAGIRREYEALKVKIIFSSLETPDSFFHTIAPGDTLSALAKKYGTTAQLLQKSNGISGDRIYAGKRLKVTRLKFSVLVEKVTNQMTLLADGKPLKRYRVATGEKGSTPPGEFKIVNKLENPTWFNEGKVIPPDSPENILGSRWLGFDLPGFGIHGTTLPETIGKQASKGCIRMVDSDAEEIYALLPVGTSVTVKE